MSTSTVSPLADFHRFVEAILQDDAAGIISPDEVLVRWKEKQRSLAAIREGLAEIDAGRTVPLDEFDRAFRVKHGIQEAS